MFPLSYTILNKVLSLTEEGALENASRLPSVPVCVFLNAGSSGASHFPSAFFYPSPQGSPFHSDVVLCSGQTCQARSASQVPSRCSTSNDKMKNLSHVDIDHLSKRKINTSFYANRERQMRGEKWWRRRQRTPSCCRRSFIWASDKNRHHCPVWYRRFPEHPNTGISFPSPSSLQGFRGSSS